MQQIAIQKANIEQFPIIQSLAEAIWHEHYVPIIGMAQVEYMLAKFYNTAAMITQQSEGQQFWLITENAAPIGFLGITPQGGDGSYFLNKFYILPTAQGKGIGQKVFDLIVSQYADLRNIRLQVNRKNYKPINFYFKLGFKIEKLAVFEIGEGYVMDDFIMRYKKKTNSPK